LNFPAEQSDQCPHCSELDDSQLALLLKRLERESRDYTVLGKIFMVGALVLVAMIVVLNA